MRLYLIRHAAAEDRAPGLPDEERALVDKGHHQARALARAFAAGVEPLAPAPELVVSSPAARAIQTAEPIADALGLEVSEDSRLLPGADVAAALSVIDELAAEEDVGSVALVGHNPTLEELAARLGDRGEGFGKGECVVFEVEGRATPGRSRPMGRWRAGA